jgi:HlyD family secretion protein
MSNLPAVRRSPPPSKAVTQPPRLVIEAFQEYTETVELPPIARSTLFVLAFLLSCGIVWASVAKLDIVVTAQGKLATRQQMPVIQAFELSLVRDILVKAGDQVKKGQVVVLLDPTMTQADAEDAADKLKIDTEVLARIDAEMKGLPYEPSNADRAAQIQMDIFKRRQMEVQAKFEVTERKAHDYEVQLAAKRSEAPLLGLEIQTAIEAEKINQVLYNDGNGSRLKLLDAMKATADARGKILQNESDQQSLEQQILAARADFGSYMGQRNRELADEYSKTRIDYDETAAKLAKANMRGNLVQLRAPVDGTVLEVAKRASGSVVREAETLVTIVPTDAETVAEVQIETKDISRIKLGDHVVMKLESLPYQQYGFLEGELLSLTPDTIKDDSQGGGEQSGGTTTSDRADESGSHDRTFYKGEVLVTGRSLRNVPPSFFLRSGMKVTAEINVGTRSVMQYILNPLTRAFSESMREP